MQLCQGSARDAAKQPGINASMSESPAGAPRVAAAASSDKCARLHPLRLSNRSGDTVGAGQVEHAAAGSGANAVRGAVDCLPVGEHRKQSGVPPAVSLGPATTAAVKAWQQQQQPEPSTIVASGSRAVSSKKRIAPMPASTGMPWQQRQQQVWQDEQHTAPVMRKKHRAQTRKPAAPSEAAAGPAMAQDVVAPAAIAVPADAQWPCRPTEAGVTAANAAAANCNRIKAYATSALKAVGLQSDEATADKILKSGMLPLGTQLDFVTAKSSQVHADPDCNVVTARFLVGEAAASSGHAAAGPPRHQLQCEACGTQCATLNAAAQHAAGKSGRASKKPTEKFLLVGTRGISLEQLLGMLAAPVSQHSPAPAPSSTAASTAAGTDQCSSQPRQWLQQQQKVQKQSGAGRAKGQTLQQQQQQQFDTARDGSADTRLCHDVINQGPSVRHTTASYRHQPMRLAGPQHDTVISSRRTAHKQQQAMRTNSQALQRLEGGFRSSAAPTPAAAIGAAGMPEAAATWVADRLRDGTQLQQLLQQLAAASGSQQEQQRLQQGQGPEQQGKRAPQEPWLWLEGVLNNTYQQQLFDLLASRTPDAQHIVQQLSCFWCLPWSSAVGDVAVLPNKRMGPTAAASSAASYWDWDQVLDMGLPAAMLQLRQSAKSPSNFRVDEDLLEMCLAAAQQVFARNAAQAISSAAAAAGVEASLRESVAPRLRRLVVEEVKLLEQHFAAYHVQECFNSIAVAVITIGCWTIDELTVSHDSSGGNTEIDVAMYHAALGHLNFVVSACELLNQLSTGVEAFLWNRAWANIRQDADRWTKRYESQQLQLQPHKPLPYSWLKTLCNQLEDYKHLRQHANRAD